MGGIFAFLALTMLATRSDHFGSAISLPDASLAVFFMAGLYSRRLLVFLAFCGLAAFSDYWAIEHRGVSSFCVTPGYGFLLPTYYVMWWAGRHTGKLFFGKIADWLSLAGLLLLACSTAFMISSGSFYLLAPYFPDHTLAEFAHRVVLYYPRYVGYAMGYLVLGLALHYTFAWAPAPRRVQHD